jgi:hypothetical protein
MNWEKELLKIRREVQAAPSRDGNQNNEGTDQQVLADISALRLLREMNRVLFEGKTRIESIRNKGKYQYLIALLWDGSIRAPKFSTEKSEWTRSIFVGIAGGKVYVNGKEVKPVSVENLQRALLVQARTIAGNEDQGQKGGRRRKG